MALFDAPTGGGGQNFVSGDPNYQRAIVENTQRQLAPIYKQALGSTMQGLSGRGLLDSGQNLAERQGLQQQYLTKLGDVSTNAATQGADIALQNQRAAQQHAWDVENQNRLLDFQRQQMNTQQEMAGADRWANLIGAGAGAIGGPLGYMAAMKFAGGPTGQATGQAPSDGQTSSNPYGVGLGNQANSLSSLSNWGG